MFKEIRKKIKTYPEIVRVIRVAMVIMVIGLVIFGLINQITVFFANSLATQMVKECKNKFDWNICYGNKLANLNSHIPLSFSLQVFSTIQKKDAQTETCHVIVHRLAWSEVEKDPQNWLALFKQIPNPNMCFTGFIHGAIEGKQKSDPDFKLTTETGNKICNELRSATQTSNMYPCGHGLGHITLVENYPDLHKAAQFCSSLQKQIARPCLDGLFMEEIFKVNLIEHGLEKPIESTNTYAKKLENTCRSFSGQQAESCWRELSILYFKMTGPDFKKVKTYCQRGGATNNINACYFRALSSIVMDKDFDKSQLPNICTDYLSDPNNLSLCYDWAITGIVYTTLQYTHLVDAMCTAAPEIFKEKCWKMKDERIQMYSQQMEKSNYF